ncbi:hypothetical protein I6G97_10220 [Edwardsiella hoshinae]|uniref:Uncharacterized protein n=2 Tax=Edwardsiella hoshinae TaxID=93378 RepID=A0A376DGQ8_9GAMM|nr:hypothetical protein I6G97_10220 [Edwardsiella hoshinae]STC89234.1 Uncharacterised protein [Edwardsiella hoshinae]
MQVLNNQEVFYQWFTQTFLFDDSVMAEGWVSESEMRALAQTMAPQRYPCLATMCPGTPYADSPQAVYFYAEQLLVWLAQFMRCQNLTEEEEREAMCD